MCRRIVLPVLFVLAVFCAAVAPVAAQDEYARAPYGTEVQPLDRILPTIRSGRPGRFYDAEGPFLDPDGGYHYRVKWLTPDGRLIWLDTDARSGRVLGVARRDWRTDPRPRGYFIPRGRRMDRFFPDPRFGRPLPGPFGGPRGEPGRGDFQGPWHGGGPGGHWHGRGG